MFCAFVGLDNKQMQKSYVRVCARKIGNRHMS